MRSRFLVPCLLALAALSACEKTITCSTCPPSDLTVSVSPKADTLEIGEVSVLTAQVSRPGNYTWTLTWESSSNAVATVDQSGRVVAISQGTSVVTLTVRCNDGVTKQASSVITVVPKPLPTFTFLIAPKSATMYVGDSLQVSTLSSPTAGVSVEWSSTAQSIASVNANGRVAALSQGSARIIARATLGVQQRFDTLNVSVLNRPVAGISIGVSPTSLTLEVTKTGQLVGVVSGPAGVNTGIIWRSRASAIATVSNTGLVTGISVGSTTVEALAVADTTKQVAVSITVVPAPVPIRVTANPDTIRLLVNESRQATAQVTGPPGIDTRVRWFSLSPGIASVSTSGFVSGIFPGTTKVYAEAIADNAVRDSIIVIVSEPIPPAPNLSFSVSPTSVSSGGNVTAIWNATGSITSCTGASSGTVVGWDGLKNSGSQSQILTAPISSGTYTLTITCVGPGGSVTRTASFSVNAPPPPNPPMISISANPTSVSSGGSTALIWTASNALSCVKFSSPQNTEWSGNASFSGSQQIVNLVQTTVFSLTCSNAGGSTTQSVTVVVTTPPPNPPSLTFSVTPTSVAGGGSVTPTWNATGSITSCTASSSPSVSAWNGSKSSGSQSQTFSAPTTPGTYTLVLECTGPGGTVSRSASFSVNAPPPPTPTLTFTASASSVAYNGSVTLNWACTNGTSNSASSTPQNTSWSGAKSLSGSQTLSNLTANITLTLTCTGAGGSVNRQISITVASQGEGRITSITISPTQIALKVASEFTFAVTVTGDSNADKTFTCAPTSNTTEFIQVVQVTSTTCRVRALKAYVQGVTPRPIIIVRTNGKNAGNFQLEAGAFVDTHN